MFPKLRPYGGTIDFKAALTEQKQELKPRRAVTNELSFAINCGTSSSEELPAALWIQLPTKYNGGR